MLRGCGNAGHVISHRWSTWGTFFKYDLPGKPFHTAWTCTYTGHLFYLTHLFIDRGVYPGFILSCILHRSKPGSSQPTAVIQDVLVNSAHLSDDAHHITCAFLHVSFFRLLAVITSLKGKWCEDSSIEGTIVWLTCKVGKEKPHLLIFTSIGHCSCHSHARLRKVKHAVFFLNCCFHFFPLATHTVLTYKLLFNNRIFLIH